jgi:DNA invertase Pin-like site-specific DNA recombinase
MQPKRMRVAAYARVSRDHERLENSLLNQVEYYQKLIIGNPNWVYKGVFIDDGISGTQIHGRQQFQELIHLCEQGEIDIILTKSISRFARNTIELLNTVRSLKKLGVDIRFEKESINTLSETGELILTLLASFAQEESRSTSENLRWAVQKRYEQGISLHHRVYGYKWTGKKLIIDPKPARVVRKIFKDYLNGKSMQHIADNLNKRGVTHFEKPFNKVAIHTILHNERYIGDTLLQKTYCADFMTHKRKKNNDQLPKFYIEQSHTPLISRETFDAVAQEITRRRELGVFNMPKMVKRCFTGKIICETCGSNYIRSYKSPSLANWRCSSNKKHGTKGCRSIGINEEQLQKLTAFVMGSTQFDEDAFTRQIDHITAKGDGNFTFHFSDGKVVTQFWDSRARAYRDTIEKRKQHKHNGEPTCQS